MKKIIITGVCLLLIGFGSYKIFEKNKISVVDKVAKLMVLPDEVPIVATVTDKTKLVSQKFFKQANNGDVVLIFTNSAKAILYRPNLNKIIDVATVLPTDEMLISSEVEEKFTIRVALYNGTKKAGLTETIDKQITAKFGNLAVETKERATRNDFEETIIVNVNGNSNKVVDGLAKLLGAKISRLPDGETKPDVDLIIILGGNLVK